MIPMVRNNKGFALVTSLMLTLISLTIVMALLYMITQSVKMAGQTKKYHTALEASYGGSEIMLKDVLPVVLQNLGSGYTGTTLTTAVQNAFPGLNVQLPTSQQCLSTKLQQPPTSWGSCSNTSSPKQSPDMTMDLQATTGSPFTVYTKIVDTVPGNSDISGLQLEGSGVAESSSLLRPQQIPYIYRIEIQGERKDNPTAQANLEVLYAY